jgi:hypothetical protein
MTRAISGSHRSRSRGSLALRPAVYGPYARNITRHTGSFCAAHLPVHADQAVTRAQGAPAFSTQSARSASYFPTWHPGVAVMGPGSYWRCPPEGQAREALRVAISHHVIAAEERWAIGSSCEQPILAGPR